jgi:spoIIIJ-associated protein
VKDRVFTGADVDDALAVAARALGLRPDLLRYLVLDPGAAGSPGRQASPARIAVLLDRTGASPDELPAQGPSRQPEDPRAGIRRILRAVAQASGLDLEVEIGQSEEALLVRIGGPGSRLFLEGDGRALRATEHILRRAFGRSLLPRRVVLDSQGYRERREDGLRGRALALARAVRDDGVARTTEALNSYERRIVHLALAEEPGIRTYSVGEEGARRVTIAPRRGEEPA